MKNIILSTVFAGALIASSGALAYTPTSKHFGKDYCDQPGFSCVKVQKGQTWASLFPDAEERNIVMRLNRSNVALKHRPWIVIPTDLSDKDLMDYAPFPEYIDPTGKRLVLIDISDQAFAAYNSDGVMVHWGPISSARGYCPDTGEKCTTVLGNFHVTRKQGAGCKSNTYPIGKGGSPMPYCMFFHKGYAIHGSTLPGFPASHGCIRLMYKDAEWLNKGFANIYTQVVVQS